MYFLESQTLIHFVGKPVFPLDKSRVDLYSSFLPKLSTRSTFIQRFSLCLSAFSNIHTHFYFDGYIRARLSSISCPRILARKCPSVSSTTWATAAPFLFSLSHPNEHCPSTFLNFGLTSLFPAWQVMENVFSWCNVKKWNSFSEELPR